MGTGGGGGLVSVLAVGEFSGTPPPLLVLVSSLVLPLSYQVVSRNPGIC